MTEVTAEMIERGRGQDPTVMSGRRKMSVRVRHAREKLTSDGAGRRIFDVELMRLYAQSHRGALPALIILALAIAGMSFIWLSPIQVAGWLSLIAVGLAAQQVLCSSLLRTAEPDISVRAWRHKFMAVEAAQGAIWAIVVLLLLREPDPVARTFVLFVLLLIAAMTSMISASIPWAVYSGLAPVVIATIAFMSPRDGFQNLPITLMAGGAQLYFVILARRLYSTSLDTLSLSMEKEALIAELEQSKLNSDEARRRAEEANLAKSRFLATMSHELRTPLNAILGFSEVMKSELFGAHGVPAYKEYSNDIHGSGQHLLMLINEILDLSRVEAGRYELREESVSVANVVEDCRHLLSLRAKNRGISVAAAIQPDLPRVWVDERAIRQITLNLLSNAIKFTPPGGSITIKVGWTAAGGQYLAIRDTGPGIPEEEIPIIMSSFGRGSLAQKNAEEGTGLGLPIVKGLIELHGGTFTLKSEVRVGTEVIVVLPPERVMNALPMIDPDAPEKKVEAKSTRRVRSAA
jgi:two-component system cell cycle sensor histidine kinase PleC